MEVADKNAEEEEEEGPSSSSLEWFHPSRLEKKDIKRGKMCVL